MSAHQRSLTPAQLDRACGVALGTAVGDALGAPYEFGSAALGPQGPQMIGGGLGGFAPGEWTDDTTMAWAILDVAAGGADLRDDAALSAIVDRFHAWFRSRPPDIGIQTRAVLSGLTVDEVDASAARTAAAELHHRTGRTAGNGSLMRTAPVALAHLDDAAATATAARAVSDLTHHDPMAGDACVLWSLAIRHAVLHEELDLRSGLAFLTPEAADFWSARIDEAESGPPSRFRPNGWVVAAFQAAWSAIVTTPEPEGPDACRHLGAALRTAIAIGDDTDTVAAIAGGLLGARWGASAVPARWRRPLHGYPGIDGERLVELSALAALGRPGPYGWPEVARIDYRSWAERPVLVPHPFDDGVLLGNALALDDLPGAVGAVVSLCLVGREQIPSGVESIRFRLIDDPAPDVNPHLDALLEDAAQTIADVRAEGTRVLVHCVAAQSRTPAVAIAYALRLGHDLADAAAAVSAALPGSSPNARFRGALDRLARRGASVP
ncbi:ADP-ribosylglycohydrolase family protein [Nocardioides fonticola]|uniref:ADP-ribosylglycohydrolase family protein n=1 Tax=Nocardioides fonticola TaxID=450363 RepID=A0ABP7Y296_9ACTN